MGSKFNYKREAEGDSIARGESDGKQNREQREREREALKFGMSGHRPRNASSHQKLEIKKQYLS